MARTLSPLALHALPETSFSPTTLTTSDATPCTCSVCCMTTPALDLSLPHSLRVLAIPSVRPTSRNATAGPARTSTADAGCHPCVQGSPLAFQPPSRPLWRLESSGPSNPPPTLRQRV